MSRRLARVVLAVALVMAVDPVVQAPASGACATLGYVADLTAADAAVSATPPRRDAALTALAAAQQAAPEARSLLAPVTSDLEMTPPNLPDARQRLDLLTAALALPPGSACAAGSPAARALLHNVYASKVFADLDQNPQPGLLAQIGQAVDWLLGHLLGALGTGGSVLLAVLVAAVIVVLVALRVSASLGGRRAASLVEPASEGDDAGEEWRLALAAAQAGEHREAIRRAFRSALLDVTGRRARLDRAWTTRELLETVAGDADLVAALAPAAAAFDRAWYGAARVTREDWEVARARCEAVRRVARRALRAGPE